LISWCFGSYVKDLKGHQETTGEPPSRIDLEGGGGGERRGKEGESLRVFTMTGEGVSGSYKGEGSLNQHLVFEYPR